MARNTTRRVVRVSGQADPVVFSTGDEQTEATPRDTGSQVQRGSRPVKEYYIYDSEFRELKRTGATATALYAFGSALLGFVVNVHTGMTFSENVPAMVKHDWTMYRNFALIGAVFCYAFGTLQALSGYNQVEQIKAQTSHSGEKYIPKPWYRIALALLGLFTAAGIGVLIGKALL